MRIVNGGGDDCASALLCPFIGDMLSQMSGCEPTGGPEEFASTSSIHDVDIINNVVVAVRISDVMAQGQTEVTVSDTELTYTLLAFPLG